MKLTEEQLLERRLEDVVPEVEQLQETMGVFQEEMRSSMPAKSPLLRRWPKRRRSLNGSGRKWRRKMRRSGNAKRRWTKGTAKPHWHWKQPRSWLRPMQGQPQPQYLRKRCPRMLRSQDLDLDRQALGDQIEVVAARLRGQL